jgi:hypothetical protein
MEFQRLIGLSSLYVRGREQNTLSPEWNPFFGNSATHERQGGAGDARSVAAIRFRRMKQQNKIKRDATDLRLGSFAKNRLTH